MTRIRGDKGKYIQGSAEPRLVRSIRATDSTWEKLGYIANQRCITRADLIEYFASNHVLHEDLSKENERLNREIAALQSGVLGVEGEVLQYELPMPTTSDDSSEQVTNSNSYAERPFARETGISRSSLVKKKKKYLDGLISESDFFAYLREQDPLSRNWRYCNVSKKYYFDA